MKLLIYALILTTAGCAGAPAATNRPADCPARPGSVRAHAAQVSCPGAKQPR